jgi:hypothetical protein
MYWCSSENQDEDVQKFLSLAAGTRCWLVPILHSEFGTVPPSPYLVPKFPRTAVLALLEFSVMLLDLINANTEVNFWTKSTKFRMHWHFQYIKYINHVYIQISISLKNLQFDSKVALVNLPNSIHCLIKDRQLTKHGLCPTHVQLENCKFVSSVFKTDSSRSQNIKGSSQMWKWAVSEGKENQKLWTLRLTIDEVHTWNHFN